MAETLLTPEDDNNTGSVDSDNQNEDQNLDNDQEIDDNKDDDKSSDDAAKDDADKGDKDKSDDKSDDKDKDDDKPDGAPETYSDFDMPEGVEINEADLGEFHTIAKELNLTQDQAQSLVDYQSKRAQALTERMDNDLADAIEKQQNDWIKELKDDKDFGGDNLDKNVGLAVKVVNKFGSPELKDVLNSSGMTNNPELVKMFNRIGKAISEDSLDSESENGETGSGKSLADKLYPNQNKS